LSGIDDLVVEPVLYQDETVTFGPSIGFAPKSPVDVSVSVQDDVNPVGKWTEENRVFADIYGFGYECRYEGAISTENCGVITPLDPLTGSSNVPPKGSSRAARLTGGFGFQHIWSQTFSLPGFNSENLAE